MCYINAMYGFSMDKMNIEEKNNMRLSKRLAYLLRYGAEKEGLEVKQGGWVSLLHLTKVPMLKYHTAYDIIKEVMSSMSFRGVKRYEKKHENAMVYVRAVYGRRMERNPCHQGSQVNRLLEICMDKVCGDLESYDLETFPDEFIINSMIHKLRRKKRLNNKSLRSLLGPVIEHLDLGTVFLTEGSIKIVAQKCPNIKVLILRDCGYVITDHYMEWLLKRLPQLESINLSGCHHLTDRAVNALCKHALNLQQLNLSGAPLISQEGVLKLVTLCPKLHHLDIFDNSHISPEGADTLAEIAAERQISVVLKCFEEKNMLLEQAPDSGTELHLASVGDYW